MIDLAQLKKETLERYKKEGHLEYVNGQAELLIEFGEQGVTLCEVNSKDLKQMRGSYFVLSPSYHNLQMFS